jgi:hypothetical protein
LKLNHNSGKEIRAKCTEAETHLTGSFTHARLDVPISEVFPERLHGEVRLSILQEEINKFQVELNNEKQE